MSQRFTVTAERGNGVWVLEAPEVGAVSQVRRLDHASREMQEAIAHLAGIPESDVEIDVQPILPDAYHRASVEAAALRSDAARLQGEAARASRAAAAALVAEGLSLRDAATIMGISHQRVAQLV